MALAGYPTSAADAKEYLEAVERFYPRLFRWGRNVVFQAKQSGGVSTIGGRRRRLYSEHAAGWKDMKYAERQSLNTVVQGSAADVFRRTLLQCGRLVPELRLLAQVHDEAIWEYDSVPTGPRLDFLQRVMETGHDFDLKVPLVFVPSICSDWSQK
jgi:DNA polymerase-1